MEKAEINEWFNKKEKIEADNEYKGYFKGKNLIYIQVESLENFVINKKINSKEITPNLNRLLKNSIYFDNYHEQTHNGISSDGDFIINTSMYPVRRGSTFLDIQIIPTILYQRYSKIRILYSRNTFR
ncbi:hypothetical protein PL321_10120 [Caloramator sp. mosi_1]|uniref:hypothetical protein n=1 Tax=Caloramator sp. mosi_1 TaxID=3023090 RepID=UPI002360CA30|nr:hypothetical protein [Caloramator sp. mosi_1]WDC83176.1 hypothetical protein PL321_10120 [Caloramator sp. mosi_1]